MSEVSPQPNTFYRIRSVDFDSCLQLWDVEEDSVVLRPLKERNLQQWLFVKEGTADNKYKIMAAAKQSSRGPAYLYVDKRRWDDSQTYEGSGRPKVVSASDATVWEVSRDPRGEGAYVLTTSGVYEDQEIFLMVNEDGKLDAVAKQRTDNPGIKPSMRWEIVQYWPSVPTGIYRIRTLTGTTLELGEDLKQLSVTPVNKDSHQEWNVDSKGNGKCVISSNTDEKLFLGWKRGRDGIAEVAASKKPVKWLIKSLGEYTYSITFDYVVDSSTTLRLALGTADEEVLLKLRKIAHDQIWFFESFDGSPSSNTVNKPPPYSSTTREINAGNYYPCNVQTNQYITFYSSATPYRWIPSSRTYNVNVSYVDNTTNSVRLAYSSYHVRFSGNSDAGFVQVVDNANAASYWVLERVENTASNSNLYYISLSTDRSLVISGDTMEDTGRVQVFTVTRRKRGNKAQQWRFET